MKEVQTAKKPKKVRGCYNCSQRRINCDRGTPQCQKCIKKGLVCSGLGLRYRFNNGVASRGKLAGSSIPVRNTDDRVSESFSRIFDDTCSGSLTGTDLALDHPPLSIDHLDAQSRFLLQYFSDSVSPAMVAVISIMNGYRDFILPLSEHDEIVRNAAMAAAAFHLSLRHSVWKETAFKHHMAAIQGLSQRTGKEILNESTIYSNLSTMILLLIEDMITGGKDYRILIRMAECFMQAGGEEHIGRRPVGNFLVKEVRKMILYAKPYISQESALQALTTLSKQDLSFLHSVLDFHPEHSPLVLRVVDVWLLARDIYLARATGKPQSEIDTSVQRFLHETLTFNAASPGGHILIWPFFIAGAECTKGSDREFIVTQLEYLWRWTGFANTLYAIDVLRGVWQASERGGTVEIMEKVEAFIM